MVDLRNLDFMDSRGLRAIIAAHRTCDDGGCPLLVLPGEQARRLFDLTGVSEMLALAETGDPRECAR
jgi:anti-anti-sigma factor